MSGSTRPRVRADVRIGPWVPGILLPLAVGLLGVGASLLVLQDLLLAVGAALATAAAIRVRSGAPWLLVALLALGQLLRGPDGLDAGLPVLVLLLHLLVVLVLLARSVPVRARVQLAALGPAALALVLVQLPAQAIAAVLLVAAGRLQVLPAASVVGALLLVLVAGLLVVPRNAGAEREDDEQDDPEV